MKKITFILTLLFAFSTIGYSQVSGYTFSQSNGTYTPITGGTVYGATTSDDQRFVDPAVPLGGTVTTGVGLPIGFDFVFNGQTYDRLAINTNGWISLGSSLLTPSVNNASTSAYTPLASTTATTPAHLRNRIAGVAVDLQGQAGSEMRLETIGSAPNRICVVQFTNMRRFGQAGHNLTFQIQLHETSNQVRVVYGTMTFNATSYTAHVGLGGSVATDFNNRSTTTNWNTTIAGTANTSSCTFVTATTAPVSGLTFTWSPPTCPGPTNVVVSNITTTTADFSWTAGGTEFDWEYLILPAGSPAPTGSGTDIATNSFTETGLNSGTAYAFWIRAYCSFSDQSNWVGPFNFTTNCVTVTSFTQNFDGVTSPAFPACWNKVGAAGTANTQNTNSNTAPNTLNIFSSSGTNLAVVAMQPVSNLGAGTHRLRMNMRANFTANGVIEFGYLTDPSNAATFVVISSVTASTLTYQQYVITPPAGSYSNFPALRHTGVPANSILIDDVVWEVIPSTPPSCATNVVATPNATCGNFANSITWDATSGADGYYVTIGTTIGGNEIADTVDISTTSYNFTGTVNTTYYYTIVPYNANGPATGCLEQSFTTNANGCYCVSNPSSNDGNGISNVQIATTDFPTGDVTYFDHTATAVDLAQGINANVQVTFQTGFTYHTNIWIDFNDDFTFDPSELVYQGESLAANPTTLNASFIMPAGAPLGNHRMRIGTADTGQQIPNPCYSGTWGVTLDFTINVVAASCTPPTVASSTVVADCVNSQYSVNVDVTALGNGTPVITDGTSNWPVTATGVITVGPFADATSVTLTLLHGSDATCDLPLGNFLNICPPTNDTCATAIPVDCSDVVVGSTANGATDTGNNASADVWYSYSGAAGDITASLCTNTTFDTFIRVFDACGGTQIASNDDSCGLQSSVTFAANGTSTYYIMVEGFGTATGNFELTVSCVLNADSFDNNNFMVYPNPVKDVLNLSYISEISAVRVVNMLGQEVISRKLNTANAQVDMTQLSAGTYIVNVTIGDTVKTIKVVKQ